MNRTAKIWIFVLVLIVTAIVLLWFWQSTDKPVYPDINSPRPWLGNKDATIVVEEFSDFQCPSCKSAEALVKDIVAAFGDRIVFFYKHFPLSSIHPFAFRAALAAECANDQGKYWEYHNLLFQNQPNFSENELINYAADLNLDAQNFSACLKSRAKEDVVKNDLREGDKRNLNATPTFFVNGDQVENWTQLKSIIQARLIGG
ncbi:MAG: thioredoxin domain-containing protein [Patescibacteria group bacterium]